MTYPDPYYGQTPGTSYYGTGGSKMVDPLAIAGAAGSVLSSAFGDKGMSGNVQKHLAREGLNQSAAPIAARLSTQLATLPLADRAAYLLAQRMGAPQGQFQAHDIYNPGASAAVPSYRTAPDLNAANAAYKPGMGGFDPGVLRQALASLNSSGARGFDTTAGAGTPWTDTTFTETRPGLTQDQVTPPDAVTAKLPAAIRKIFGK